MRKETVMRTIIYLILSLALAAALCLGLMTTGVLKFSPDTVVTRLRPIKEKALSGITRAMDALQDRGGDTSAGIRQKITASLPPADRTLPMEAVAGSPVTDRPVNTDRDILIHTRALEFLSAMAGKGGADIEDRFAEFLMRELEVNEKDTARLVRMSFWKNFVTLQEQWEPGSGEMMNPAFRREKELKKAGFAAKGLRLMEGEIQQAETRLKQ